MMQVGLCICLLASHFKHYQLYGHMYCCLFWHRLQQHLLQMCACILFCLTCYLSVLQWAHAQGIDMRILSDCNSVFISHMLTGAKVNTRVKEVITNLSSFVRCQTPSSSDNSPTQTPREADSAQSDAESSTAATEKAQSASRGQGSHDGVTWAAANEGVTGSRQPASHQMVIQPRHDWMVSSHGCPLCPANLCKVSAKKTVNIKSPLLPGCQVWFAVQFAHTRKPSVLAPWQSCKPRC